MAFTNSKFAPHDPGGLMDSDDKFGNHQGNWRETVPNLNTGQIMAARVNEKANNAIERENNARLPSPEKLKYRRSRLLAKWIQEYDIAHKDDGTVDGCIDYISDKIHNEADDNNVADWDEVIKEQTDNEGFRMMFGGRKNRFKSRYYKRKQSRRKQSRRKQSRRKQSRRKKFTK